MSKELIKKENNKEYILPFIDNLVSILYNKDINNLIMKNCNDEIDKKTILMFIILYFFTHIKTIDVNIENKEHELKKFISKVILDSNKRKECIEVYLSLEKLINITQSNTISNNEN